MAARGYVVEGAVVLPAAAAATTNVSAQSDDRLRQLDSLQAEGLITAREYRQKRAAIMGHEGGATEERLLELKELLDKRLISRGEYDKKREEILDAL
jgi:hypothetical protein